MAFLSEEDRRRIETAIADAERRTTGEIVTVIADRSGHYLYIPTLLAATAVFVLSGLALLLPIPLTLSTFYVCQVLGFLAIGVTLAYSPIRMRLVPRSVTHRQAHLLAHEQFLDLGLSSTSNRTGVMLFVSVAERYVEIIADSGIQSKVEPDVWQRIVAGFIGEVKAGRVADGFVMAIEACAWVLAEHFPWHDGDSNELPNQLIEIERG
jgi:putative membrane protein